MKEEFLHYLWKHKFFVRAQLKTICGKTIHIKHPGIYNHDAGPDFLQARLIIDSVEWCGDVEIHIRTSDFFRHKHQEDPAYNKLLLHVVHEHDSSDELNTFTCEIKDSYDKNLLENYRSIFNQKNALACRSILGELNSLHWDAWMDRMLRERLEKKYNAAAHIFETKQHHPDEALYMLIASAFGFNINREAFEMLALQTPYRWLLPYRDNRIQVEAMLMGQAGLLESADADEYILRLQNEYAFLQHKHKLKKQINIPWKYLRLRPVNFPCIRLSQFAGLICRHHRLHDVLVCCKQLHELTDALKVKADTYWNTHYLPGKAVHFEEKWLGSEAVQGIILNAIIPYLLLMGVYQKEGSFVIKAYDYIEQLRAENNKITRYFSDAGKKPKHAGDSQAQKHLYENYCMHRQCLHCAVGKKLIATESNPAVKEQC
jgi:hypothetical protein